MTPAPETAAVANTAPKVIVGLGELLWDLLPSGPQLGGAPTNFAVMAGRLGDHAVCASRLGDDDLGRKAYARLADLPVDLSSLQTDPQQPTGSVSVRLTQGQPKYVIHEPAAWDFLELTAEWLALAGTADAVCFGSLGQRGPRSHGTTQGFLEATSSRCVRVFDVNLRPPFYSADTIRQSLERATILKMNDAEVPQLLSLLGTQAPSGTLEIMVLESARKLLDLFPLDLVCITLGGHGSLLVTRNEVDRHPGIPVQILDTVGAGDAFTAALTHFYLRNAPLEVLSEAGNRWGSWVASQAGGMPALDTATLECIDASIRKRIPA